ncbi:hypothetical protein FRD01_22545 [Microvenator marinus]|uniref:Uncharacterized protein n=1 Tax=Microvenator marinus TaxID=2600177 RepID=A0A5B8XWZ7_9DELT|nr:hypothetical protein [Microvenator marinus]QED29964.1 hypothetical protein FRD01_22545 [Microvenator marinus]
MDDEYFARILSIKPAAVAKPEAPEFLDALGENFCLRDGESGLSLWRLRAIQPKAHWESDVVTAWAAYAKSRQDTIQYLVLPGRLLRGLGIEPTCIPDLRSFSCIQQDHFEAHISEGQKQRLLTRLQSLLIKDKSFYFQRIPRGELPARLKCLNHRCPIYEHERRMEWVLSHLD